MGDAMRHGAAACALGLLISTGCSDEANGGSTGGGSDGGGATASGNGAAAGTTGGSGAANGSGSGTMGSGTNGSGSGTTGSGTNGSSNGATGSVNGGGIDGGGASNGTASSNGGSSNGGSSNGGSSNGQSSTGGDAGGGASPIVGGCSVFPPGDAWNRDISGEPADTTWTNRLQQLVGDIDIHPDFGGPYGIPYNLVPQSQATVPITFDWYPEESDPGPYPFPGPGEIAIEGGDATSCDGDCHVLVIQQGSCMLYEGYACEHRSDGWHCGNGAHWDLNEVSLGQRPKGWTSADAAGLPIFPGVLRHEEVAAGEVDHAIRFTVHCTRDKYVAPATHFAVPDDCNAGDPNAPPMGLRVRLKADYDTSGLPADAVVILTAMKRYGMILADNGSDFYFQGDVSDGWSDATLDALKAVPASAFEAITPPPLEP